VAPNIIPETTSEGDALFPAGRCDARLSDQAAPAPSRIKTWIINLAQAVFPDRQFISILKFEIVLLMIAVYSKLSPVEWIKRASHKKATGLKLNVGNGPFRRDGWINVDCRLSFNRDDLVCDLRRKWPLRTGSARYIFSEHVVEHFVYPEQTTHLLEECRRILEPGGVLRIIVPDAERYLRAYAHDDQEFIQQAAGGESVTPMSLVNVMMRENGFHKYAYDYDELERTLKRVGFSVVKRSSFGDSPHRELNLDLNDSLRRAVSLYVEAVK
jgi:predicted SAM-dependent methyltransferase